MLNTLNNFEDFWCIESEQHLPLLIINASLLIKKYLFIYFKNILWIILCICINQNIYTVF